MGTPTNDVMACPAKRGPGVIIGFTNPTELVYHYTTVKTARDYIVAQRKLKLGSIRKTNDPKETGNWKFTLGTNRGANLMEYYPEELSAKMTDALKEFTKVACFCQDTPPLTGDSIRDLFSRGWTKPRLWSHYASEYRGVCLAFNRTRLDAAIRNHFANRAHVFAGEVSYVNRSIPYDWQGDFTIIREYLDSLGFDGYIQSHIEQSVRPLFFEKMADWRDEREFRWLVFDTTGDDSCLSMFRTHWKQSCTGSERANLILSESCKRPVI